MTRIELDRPAKQFDEAFLLGNGWLGASVHGRPGVEDIDLNVDTLWSAGPCSPAARPGARDLEQLRERALRGDIEGTEALAAGLRASEPPAAYLPLGRLSWAWSEATEDPAYVRALDLHTAEATTRSGGATLACFVSAPDGVLVATAPRTTGSGDLTWSTQLRTDHIEQVVVDGVRWLVAAGRAPVKVAAPFEETDEPVVYADDHPDADGTVAAGMGWALVAAVVEDGDERRLVASAETGFRGWAERPSADLDALVGLAKARVQTALGRTTAGLRERHLTDHRAHFDRAELDLSASSTPAAEAAKLHFDLGRYLMLASSRPGSQAANLQGLWNTELRALWGSGYTTNINLEMAYWAAELVQLPEAHEPLLDLIADLAVAGVETAQATYGAKGAVTHHNTDLWRYTAAVPGRSQWSNWHTGLAWLAWHVSDRLDFAWDETYARERGLPVLRAAAASLLDTMVEGPAGGLVVVPSTSPEHEFTHAGEVGAVTYGSAIDQELAIGTFQRFLTLSTRLGVEDDLTAAVAAAKVAVPGIDEAGRLAEWAAGYAATEPGHRHHSHLLGLYPGTRITETATPEHFAAARAALAQRLHHGSGFTGWSQAWTMCLAARLREPEVALRSFEILTGFLTSPSSLAMHPLPPFLPRGVFQVDGNLGLVAGIVEMLVQSHDGAISLLPALPAEWSDGTVCGLATRGGTIVSMTWADGRLVRAELEVTRLGDVMVEIDADITAVVTSTYGAAVDTVVSAGPEGRQRWSWTANTTQTYVLEPSRRIV